MATLMTTIRAMGKEIKEEVELDEAKEVTPKDVEDYLVKTGVNPKDAKDAVKKGFGYASKKYGGPTHKSAVKKIADVIWSLHEEDKLTEALCEECGEDPCVCEESMDEKRKYTPPTEAEKKKDKDREAGKGDRMYGKMRGGLKKEEVEIDFDAIFEETFTEKEVAVKLTLEDTMRLVVVAEASGDKEAYTKFFKSALKKFGVSSPSELSGDKEKEFYDYVDKNWEGDNEKPEQNESACKSKKKMSESDAEKSDEEEMKAIGKTEKKMKVDVDPKLQEDLSEAEMTADQEKKREEIVLKLKKKEDEFKAKYGDRWKDVMYATATKMAMKS
jgi:hypothetical protein